MRYYMCLSLHISYFLSSTTSAHFKNTQKPTDTVFDIHLRVLCTNVLVY